MTSSSLDKDDSPGSFMSGSQIHPCPGQGLLWLESEAQAHLEAEVSDHAPAGSKKPPDESLKISAEV